MLNAECQHSPFGIEEGFSPEAAIARRFEFLWNKSAVITVKDGCVNVLPEEVLLV
jgi:hypothetical protein